LYPASLRIAIDSSARDPLLGIAIRNIMLLQS